MLQSKAALKVSVLQKAGSFRFSSFSGPINLPMAGTHRCRCPTSVSRMCNQRKVLSALAAGAIITGVSTVKEGQPERIVGKEMRRWGGERAGEHEQQELVRMLTGVSSSSSSRCCHSYPDPGCDPADTNSVLLANKRREETPLKAADLSIRYSLLAFSQMLRNEPRLK